VKPAWQASALELIPVSRCSRIHGLPRSSARAPLLRGSRESRSALVFWHKNECLITKPRCEGVMAECQRGSGTGSRRPSSAGARLTWPWSRPRDAAFAHCRGLAWLTFKRPFQPEPSRGSVPCQAQTWHVPPARQAGLGTVGSAGTAPGTAGW